MSGDDYLWDKSGEPDPDVVRLERALAPLRHLPRALAPAIALRPKRSRGLAGVALMIAAVLGAFVAIAVAPGSQPSAPAPALGPAIEVARLSGAPRLRSGPLVGHASFRVGDWVVTDASSHARVGLGELGTIEVEPGSKVAVAALGPDQKRLSLEYGAISAKVDAPPRLFVVDTPSAAAVDLGCAYRLEVTGDGAALLKVTTGYVSLEGAGKTALVPAGAECRTKTGHGPGTPRFADAPRELAAAVDHFDVGGDEHGLIEALASARRRDSLTLWHLFWRVRVAARGPVLDRLRAIAPPEKAFDSSHPELLDHPALAAYEAQLRDAW